MIKLNHLHILQMIQSFMIESQDTRLPVRAVGAWVTSTQKNIGCYPLPIDGHAGSALIPQC